MVTEQVMEFQNLKKSIRDQAHANDRVDTPVGKNPPEGVRVLRRERSELGKLAQLGQRVGDEARALAAQLVEGQPALGRQGRAGVERRHAGSRAEDTLHRLELRLGSDEHQPVSAADRVIDPDLQRSMAERAGSTVVQFDDASHAGGFTHYATRFANLIEAAARATTS